MKPAFESGWYQGLKKPSIVPPGYFFTIIWSLIYLLLAWASFLGHRRADPRTRMLINIAFVVNLGLNILWTYLFFSKHDMKTAGLILAILFVETFWLAYLVYTVHRSAGLSFILYLGWLLVAGYYNYYIATNN